MTCEPMRDHGVIPAHEQPIAVLDPRSWRDPDGRPGMVEFVFAVPGDTAQLRIDDRLEVAAFLVGRPAVGRFDDQRATLAPQNVDQRQLFERQVVDPERACALAPEADVEVGLRLVEAVENDLDPLPVLVRFEASLVERELPSRPARRRARADETTRSVPGRGSLPSMKTGRPYSGRSLTVWIRRTLGDVCPFDVLPARAGRRPVPGVRPCDRQKS